MKHSGSCCELFRLARGITRPPGGRPVLPRVLLFTSAVALGVTLAVTPSVPAASSERLQEEPLPSAPVAVSEALVKPEFIDFGVADATGRPSQPVRLTIMSNADAAGDDLFTVSDLPPEVSLSAGARYNDFWVMKRRDLQELSLTAPAGYAGSFRIAVTRTRKQTRPPQTLYIDVSLSSGEAGVASAEKTKPPSESNRIVPQPLSSEEKITLDHAYTQFKKGDVAASRATFEYLAIKGHAEAAEAMGETYDPAVLKSLYIKGLQADEIKARDWYMEARRLDGAGAKVHLDALNQR